MGEAQKGHQCVSPKAVTGSGDSVSSARSCIPTHPGAMKGTAEERREARAGRGMGDGVPDVGIPWRESQANGHVAMTPPHKGTLSEAAQSDDWEQPVRSS